MNLNLLKPFNPEDYLVLVVDDVNKNLQFVVEILNEAGYATTFATSGQQAYERIKTVHPDLILLDLMLPEKNGLELCKKLKSNLDNAEIPIIFLTVSDRLDDLVDAFKLGAVDYVTKPFRVAELLARVQTHLRLKCTIKELKNAYIQLEHLANTDPLTGVANRRGIFDFVEQEFYRAKRYSFPFSVLIIDLDHFKRINDSYGHDSGDGALKLVSKSIDNSIRQIDLLGRFGGEEFIVILPQTRLEQAVIVAERIRLKISQCPLIFEQKTVKITASIGIAAYNQKDTIIDEIIQRADKGLYLAKERGRNQVVRCDINDAFENQENQENKIIK